VRRKSDQRDDEAAAGETTEEAKETKGADTPSSPPSISWFGRSFQRKGRSVRKRGKSIREPGRNIREPGRSIRELGRSFRKLGKSVPRRGSTALQEPVRKFVWRDKREDAEP